MSIDTATNSEFATETQTSNEMDARLKLKSQFDLFSYPLPTEAELFEIWEDRKVVIVSIACATFNHGTLLEDAIKSFLLQRTDFRFEIVIRDDASTDGTRDVIAHYTQHYPRIIRSRIYEDNQLNLGRRPGDDWDELTSGKYVALCEGDDFWIDHNKLQDQVAQLERNPDTVISVAGTFWFNLMYSTMIERGVLDDETLYTDLPTQYHHTSTFLIERKSFIKAISKRKKYGMYGDTALRHLLVEQGNCISLPRVVSVYWINNKGIWSSLSNARKSKDHILIYFRLIRAVTYRRKPTISMQFLHACANYFPISVHERDWPFTIVCFTPFAVRKFVRLTRLFMSTVFRKADK